MQTLAATSDNQTRLDRHAVALRGLLAIILVWIGVADDTGHARRLLGATDRGEGAAARAFAAMTEPGTISRRVHGLVRRLLLPVEAATRRLIVVLASDLPVPELPARKPVEKMQPPTPTFVPLPRTHDPDFMVPAFLLAAPEPPAPPKAEPKLPKRMPRFRLTDPLKRIRRGRRWVRQTSFPRITWFGAPSMTKISLPPLPTPYDLLPDRGLMRRVAALASALQDLPRQAERLAMWRARRNAGLTRRQSPLRPGPPPGSPPLSMPSRDHRDEHDLVTELHSLAFHVPDRRDSS